MKIPVEIVDTVLQAKINAKAEKLATENVKGRDSLLRKISSEKTVLDVVVWCADYGLECSLEACTTYVKHCLTRKYTQSRLEWSTTGHGGHEIALAIHCLMEKGHLTAAAKFGADLLDRMRLIG